MKSYGVLKLTVTSPVQSFSELLTVAECKTFLGLPTYSPVQTTHDAQLEMFITAAREQAEWLQQKPLVAAQYDLRLDDFDGDEIDLGDELDTVDLVTYKDSAGAVTTMAEGTDYIVDTVRGLVMPPYGESWPSFTPWPSSAITIRHSVTPPAVHAIVKAGMLFLVAAWFENRLPFEPGANAVHEYPYSVTNCLSFGAKRRVW